MLALENYSRDCATWLTIPYERSALRVRPRGEAAYTTSKGAVNALTQVMAVDHAAQGIRVTRILPGPVFTPMVQAGGLTPEQRELRAKGNLLGIEGTGWDVGWAAVSLASPEARWITGQLLCVDGGVTLLSPPRGYGAVADTSPRSPCLRPTARQQGPLSSAGSYW